jgi:hypothetical protein
MLSIPLCYPTSFKRSLNGNDINNENAKAFILEKASTDFATRFSEDEGESQRANYDSYSESVQIS